MRSRQLKTIMVLILMLWTGYREGDMQTTQHKIEVDHAFRGKAVKNTTIHLKEGETVEFYVFQKPSDKPMTFSLCETFIVAITMRVACKTTASRIVKLYHEKAFRLNHQFNEDLIVETLFKGIKQP